MSRGIRTAFSLQGITLCRQRRRDCVPKNGLGGLSVLRIDMKFLAEYMDAASLIRLSSCSKALYCVVCARCFMKIRSSLGSKGRSKILGSNSGSGDPPFTTLRRGAYHRADILGTARRALSAESLRTRDRTR